MARTSDHAARRQQIIGGVRTLATGKGLGAVTIAGIARAAGVSVGMVQHYYDSKDDLFADTFVSIRSDIEQRADAAIAEAEKQGDRIENMLFAGLSQLLPLDSERQQETYLTRVFAGLALENERLAATLIASDDALTTRIAQGLENGKECGEVEPNTDSDIAAYALLALTNGLAGRLLMHSHKERQLWSQQSVAKHLAHLCPGECSRYA